jgi:hypothetical protein
MIRGVGVLDHKPNPASGDIILSDPDPATVAEIGRSVGATAIAIRDFETAAVGVGVEWARDVASRL